MISINCRDWLELHAADGHFERPRIVLKINADDLSILRQIVDQWPGDSLVECPPQVEQSDQIA